jgi:hypothetical protein
VWPSIRFPSAAMVRILEPHESVEDYECGDQNRKQTKKDDRVEHSLFKKEETQRLS